jgi:hypothetical protein
VSDVIETRGLKQGVRIWKRLAAKRGLFITGITSALKRSATQIEQTLFEGESGTRKKNGESGSLDALNRVYAMRVEKIVAEALFSTIVISAVIFEDGSVTNAIKSWA